MFDADRFVVPVQRHAIGEGQHGQRFGSGRWNSQLILQFQNLFHGHPLAHIVVRHDDRPGRAKRLIAADVIKVVMRVDDAWFCIQLDLDTQVARIGDTPAFRSTFQCRKM